jgi:hypothetical protein
LRIRVPSGRICESFHLTYEPKGAQKGADVLTEYNTVRRMRIVLDGRKVNKKFLAEYRKSNGYFKKRGLTRRLVLHELYHHLVALKGLKTKRTNEEIEVDRFARQIMRRLFC